jgi:hypothetical protein
MLLLGFATNASQATEQLLLAGAAALGEFAGAVAHVGRAAKAGDDPLPQVTRQVQQQVADAVSRSTK